jgi:uncharacterized repeat protein (TIGR01451 family)
VKQLLDVFDVWPFGNRGFMMPNFEFLQALRGARANLANVLMKFFTALFAFTISLVMGANLLGAYEIPTTPAGSWTAVGVTTGTIAGGSAAETGTYYKTTPSGLRLTVTVNGAFPNGTSGAYFSPPSGTSTTGLNPSAAGTNPGVFTTTPVLPAGSNPINLLVSANPCQTSFPSALTCTGLGSVLVTLTDPTGGAVPVVAPKIHVSRLGGTVGSMELATGLQINAGASSPGIGFAATSAATATLSVQGGNEFFGNPNAGTVNLNVNCGATATSSAGCGTVQVTGNAATIQMNVNSYRTNVAPNAWTNGADAFFFDMSFDEDFGGAPASYDSATAAGHLVTDLRLGATVSVENPLVVNGTATGTTLISASPNAVVAPAVAGDSNDGVTSFPPLTTADIGSSYTVTPTISGASRAGKICGWVDFDRSGTFTASEGVCNSFASGATSAPLAWTVPTATTAGPTYARVRVTYDTNMSTASFNGLFSSGEVEDYLVQIKPVVKIVKALVPTTDAGTFNLSINGTNFASAIGNNGTTNFKTVYHTDTPDVTVATDISAAAIAGVVLTETGAGSTNLSNYVTTSACINAAGTAVTVAGTALAPSVTIPQSIAGASANGQAQTITCTLTNTAKPKLTLVKTVTNDNGGSNVVADFTLNASGPTSITGLTGTTAITNAVVNAGTYTLTETGAAVANYIAGAWSCTAGTLTSNSLVLANNQTATCTLNNNDKPKLTLVKSVVNTGGGVATAANFPLTATGPSTITGLTGAPSVTSAIVDVGTYALSETPLASYTAGAWSCSAGTVAGSNVTLTAANNATCTIVNTFVPAPALTTAKSGAINAGVDGVINAGDIVTFTYTVQNTGNVPLTSVVPVDVGPKFNGVAGSNVLSAFAPTSATVAVGGSQVFTASYVLSQADVNNAAGITNGFSNTATAKGTPPVGAPVTSASSIFTTTIPKIATLTTAKSAGAPTTNLGAIATATDALDTITYTYTVTNTGNVTLSNLVPNDAGPKFNGVSGTGTLGAYTPTNATVAPGASQVFTATYVLSQADVNSAAGVTNGVSNSATASGKAPDGLTATSGSSTATTTINKASSLSTVKAAGAPTIAAGAVNSLTDGNDTITYTYTVTNTGNVTLTSVAPIDGGPKFNGVSGTGTLGAYTPATANLAPGASQLFTATYVLTQGDVNNAAGVLNGVTNSAIASGTMPGGGVVSSSAATATTAINKTSSLSTVKTASAATVAAGAVNSLTDGSDTITYTYTVTNTGNVTLTNVVPVDAGPTFAGTAGSGTLAAFAPATANILPGASQIFTAVYTLSQGDVNKAAGISKLCDGFWQAARWCNDDFTIFCCDNHHQQDLSAFTYKVCQRTYVCAWRCAGRHRCA